MPALAALEAARVSALVLARSPDAILEDLPRLFRGPRPQSARSLLEFQ